jgi:sulfofructose kinase
MQNLAMTLPASLTQSKPVALTVLGHAAVSHHFQVDEFPQFATKTPATAHHELIGGMGANAAIAAARLGAEVRFISCVGDDALADQIEAHLEGEGIDTSGMLRHPGKQTSISSVIVDARGERWVFNHRGSAILESGAVLDVALLQGSDALLVDPRWSRGALAALHWARRAGVLSVLDADIAPQADLAALVAQVDWAAFSLGGLRSFAPGVIAPTGVGSPQALRAALLQARDAGARETLVTLGEWGVRRLNDAGDGLEPTPSPKVHAIDTTGAGDVFHAALAVALAEARPREEALRFACTAAALKCAGGMGADGAPSRESVEAALKDNPGF